ncbi:MAG: hypothetical protein EOR81_01305 [Mesorhizobium sp.]|nr:MAG: hypothetical protein EOR81_01305 [Mesorhizobium sp.]
MPATSLGGLVIWCAGEGQREMGEDLGHPALPQQGFARSNRFPKPQPSLSAGYRIGRLSRRYRIGMTIHNLPDPSSG